jgi:hypothetical protein
VSHNMQPERYIFNRPSSLLALKRRQRLKCGKR